MIGITNLLSLVFNVFFSFRYYYLNFWVYKYPYIDYDLNFWAYKYAYKVGFPLHIIVNYVSLQVLPGGYEGSGRWGAEKGNFLTTKQHNLLMYGVRSKVAEPKLTLPGSRSNPGGKTGAGSEIHLWKSGSGSNLMQLKLLAFWTKNIFFVKNDFSYKTLTSKITICEHNKLSVDPRLHPHFACLQI